MSQWDALLFRFIQWEENSRHQHVVFVDLENAFGPVTSATVGNNDSRVKELVSEIFLAQSDVSQLEFSTAWQQIIRASTSPGIWQYRVQQKKNVSGSMLVNMAYCQHAS